MILRLPRAVAIVAATGVMTLTAGCASSPVSADRAAFAAAPTRNAIPLNQRPLEPERTLLLDVRLDRQIAPNGCGAHAVASLIDYWIRAVPGGPDRRRASGSEILARAPPQAEEGYSLAEVARLLGDAGLNAIVVNITADGLRRELAAGRPVIARVSLPITEVRQKTILPRGLPLLSELETNAFAFASGAFRAGWLDHCWIVAGHDAERFIVLDPAMGLRAVRNDAFERAVGSGGRLAVVSGGWSS